MCGRFANIDPINKIAKTFFIDEVSTCFEVSYNISPGVKIPAVKMDNNKRFLVDFKWGLVPSWSKDSKIGNRKQPVYVRLTSRDSFGFAGLYEKWLSPEGEELSTCTIITTTPNKLLENVHSRMPVIISQADEGLWIDPAFSADDAAELLRPYPSEEMEYYPVSDFVNRPGNDSPDCIKPI